MTDPATVTVGAGASDTIAVAELGEVPNAVVVFHSTSPRC